MQSKKKINLVIITMLIIAVTGCAKKMPEQESRDIRESVIPLGIFDSSATIKLHDADNRNMSDEIDNSLAINELGSANLDILSADEQLKPFFKDLQVERFAPGEELKVTFQLTKGFLVAYAEVNENEKLSTAAKDLTVDGQKIALFQFPVDAYGIKRRIVNSLGEETRDIEFVQTNKNEAAFAKINSIVTNRKNSGILGLDQETRNKIILKNRLENKTWTVGQIRRLFNNKELMQRSAHSSKAFPKDERFLLKSFDKALYIYRVIGKEDLSDREKIASRFGFVIRAFKPCSETEAASFGRVVSNCFLRSEYKANAPQIRLKSKRDQDDSLIAEAELSEDLGGRQPKLIHLKESVLSDTVLEITQQVPTRANRFLFAISELKNTTQTIKLTTTTITDFFSDEQGALREMPFFDTDYQGPEILKDFFQGLKIQASESGEVFEVLLKIGPTNLTAYYKKAGHKIPSHLKLISDSALVPLFQFGVQNYGVIERTQNQDLEDVDLEFKQTIFDQASHIIIPNDSDMRTLAGLNSLGYYTRWEIELKKDLDQKIMSIKELHSRFKIEKSDNPTLRQHPIYQNQSDELIHLQVFDNKLLIGRFKKLEHLNSFEKASQNILGKSRFFKKCSEADARKAGFETNNCFISTEMIIIALHVRQKIDTDTYGYEKVSVNLEYLPNTVTSDLVQIGKEQQLMEFSIKTMLEEEIYSTRSVSELNKSIVTQAELNGLFPGSELQFSGLFSRQFVQTMILGRTLYILTPKTKTEMTMLERGMIGRDPRYTTCNAEQARLANLQISDCVMSAERSMNVTLYGIKTVIRENRTDASIVPDYTISSDRADLVEFSPSQSFRRFEFNRNLRLQDNVILSKTENFDLEDEYLYLPSTHDTPKDVVAADPFFQGNEKIVKLKFSQEGLDVLEVIDDERFIANQLNSSPVMTIRGQHVDFTCQKDAQGICTDEIVQDSTDDWQKRAFFMPNLDNIDVKEVNTLNLFTVSESCIIPLESKMTHYEIKKGIINIEVERTFKVNEQSRCIVRLFYDDKLSSASFKVKYFYSLVRLKDLVSTNYEKVAYPITEQDDFGFFKTEKSVLNNTFDDSRSNQVTWLNRFNPKKGDIVYRLSKSFDRAENAHIKEATYKVIENLNKTLSKANSGIQIRLENPSDIYAGDLRNNSIVLIDEPLANGLLGYGPSVANPRTGEIVQAHTNMYSGVLKTLSRHVYQSMVDLSKKERDAKNEPVADSSGDDSQEESAESVANHDSTHAHDAKDHTSTLNLRHIARKSIPNLAIKETRLNAMNSSKQKQKEDLRHQLSDADFIHSLGRSNSREALQNGEVRDLLRANPNLLSGKNGYDAMIERYSKRCAFHKDFLLAGNLGKTYIRGILDIAGIQNADKTLKNWEELSLEQQETASKLIVTHAYSTTLAHELGHNLGLRHNFTGSADKENFYTLEEMREIGRDTIPAYSSIMDYGFSELNELPVMGKYDIAALRFGYAREIENDKGEFIQIPTTLTELKVGAPDLKFKNYEFCTDENAGLSVKCNRFDEGTSITEIANHYIEKYRDFYKYRNFRDGRNDFSTFDVGQYVWARTSEFRRMRVILEDFEFFGSIFGKDIMASGCNAAMTARYPICKEINDRVTAAKLIGNFFVDILNTPDLLCALVKKDAPTKIVELRPLVKIYNDIKFGIDKKIITSCFEPEVNAGLAEDNFEVVAEGGKSLISYKGTDPRFKYKTDIDVMGIWPDKILAMKALFTRQSNTGSTEDGLMSFMDIPEIAERVEDFLGHIILDRPLENKIAFKTATGEDVEIDYKLNLDNYVIPEQPHWYPIVAFSLPFSGTARLNQIMLKSAAMETLTTDPEFKTSSEALKAGISVYRSSIQDRLGSEHMKTLRLGQHVYGAAEDNIFAGTMIKSIQAENFLSTLEKPVIMEVFMKRARPAVPTDLSEAETLAFKVPDALLNQMIELIEQGVTLEREMIVGQFGEELGSAIWAAYNLGVDGIKKIIKLKEDLRKAPADASEVVKKLYEIELETLQAFLTNKLNAKNQAHLQSIPLLPNMNSNPMEEIMQLMGGF